MDALCYENKRVFSFYTKTFSVMSEFECDLLNGRLIVAEIFRQLKTCYICINIKYELSMSFTLSLNKMKISLLNKCYCCSQIFDKTQ